MTFLLVSLIVDIVMATILMIPDRLQLKSSLYLILEEVTIFKVHSWQCVNNNVVVFNEIVLSLIVAPVLEVPVLTTLTQNIRKQSFSITTKFCCISSALSCWLGRSNVNQGHSGILPLIFLLRCCTCIIIPCSKQSYLF